MNPKADSPILSGGLHFQKFDLHVHTPASKDYSNKVNVLPGTVVDAALAKGLAGIAVTDHQTGGWIDEVKKAADGKGLVVFPGVELLVTGGEEGVHTVILFDIDKDSKHVDQFLNKLGIYDKRGERTVAADLTVGQVADELEKYDPSALLVLPHCHSSKGVLGDMKGETRVMIFDGRRKCLLGAETSEADFTNEQKGQKHKRVVDLLDGTDENYHFRKLGVYCSSDAHSPTEIGCSFTYFKVDEYVTIEDIRQCLIDRDTRIRQSFELHETINPRIDEITIDSGFLADQTLTFHEGLNSILGAKGSGKSLAVEFLRFALNQPPQSDELLDDHNDKIEKCLLPHGSVTVTITDESGRQYVLVRTCNPTEGDPTVVLDASDGMEKEVAVDEFFPVLFLSQGEIAKIAEDRTGASQRGFIDKFFDFHRFQRLIEELNRELGSIDDRFVKVLQAHRESVELKKKLATVKEEIAKLERQIQNPVFNEFSKKESVGRAIQAQTDFIDSVRESLTNTQNEYADLVAPSAGDSAVDADPAVKRAVERTTATLNEIKNRIATLISSLDKEKGEVEKEYKSWEALFKPVKQAYDQAVKASGGTQIGLSEKRKQMLDETAKIETALAKAQATANLASSISQRRREVLNKLDEVRKAYFEERKHRCDFFTMQSMGTLNVTIQQSEDKTTFKQALLGLKRGSWLRSEDVERISQAVPPRTFVRSLLQYEWSLREKTSLLDGIAEPTGMKFDTVQKLADFLLDTYEYKDILGLLYASPAEDVPSIAYKVGDKFKPLSELSVGQKAVALLIIALSDGGFPIIVDQPEDSLDLRTIWDDLCSKLRGAKDRRQFIFTTHNSSVAVASDTDKFTILQATADHGTVMFSGSMNRQDMKGEVIAYLEGGENPYFLKRRKYNL
ncbi:MAG: AAA family ATPase [Deltaproteobacteria bacterium]|nr:AAA family ATPase [Deltaproteobacteria bacterium]